MGNATVGDFRKFLDQFEDSAEIGVIMAGYGGSVTDFYLMQDFPDEPIENPSPVPYPTLLCGYLPPTDRLLKGDDPRRLWELFTTGEHGDREWARKHLTLIAFGADDQNIRRLCEILWRVYIKDKTDA